MLKKTDGITMTHILDAKAREKITSPAIRNDAAANGRFKEGFLAAINPYIGMRAIPKHPAIEVAKG
jgi:hypothetical protein